MVVAEPERDAIIAATSGHTLIGPGSIPWEIGNAFMDIVSITFDVSNPVSLVSPKSKRAIPLFL